MVMVPAVSEALEPPVTRWEVRVAGAGGAGGLAALAGDALVLRCAAGADGGGDVVGPVEPGALVGVGDQRDRADGLGLAEVDGDGERAAFGVPAHGTGKGPGAGRGDLAVGELAGVVALVGGLGVGVLAGLGLRPGGGGGGAVVAVGDHRRVGGGGDDRMTFGQGLPGWRVSVMVALVTVLLPLAAAGSGTSTES